MPQTLVIEKEVDGIEVRILYDGEDMPCYLYCRIIAHDIKRIDTVFRNPTMLSATLRGELGYMPACEILRDSGVSFQSQLWNLNHDGPPRTWLTEEADKLFWTNRK